MSSLHNRYSTWRHCLIWTGPSYKETRLSKGEIKNLFRSTDAWMLRNIYDWDCSEPTNFWEVICDKAYEIAELPSKTRNQVRRSLRDCEITILTKEELVAKGGYDVYISAFKRYHDITVKPMTREVYEKCVLDDTYGEYWGVMEKESGKLIAYGKNFRRGDMVNYAVLKAIPEYMNKHYPYFGLIYTMNQHYLGELGCKYVTDGFRSITEHSNIQPFLEKNFLFRKAYCRFEMHYRSWFGIAVKLLYPFRNLFPVSSVKNVLKQEAVNRGDA